MKIKIKFLLLLLVFTKTLYSQVGVNTSNPFGSFHIDGAKDNGSATSTSITIAQQSNDFIVLPSGNIGVGMVNPKVRLDLRSQGSTQNAIGIGSNTLTANEAGEGAIRYESGLMQYSNGLEWINLNSSSQPEKMTLAVTNNTTATILNNNTATVLTSWPTVVSNTFGSGSFSNGVFTSPKDAVYMINGSFLFASSSVVSGSYVQINFQILDPSNTIIDQNKCTTSFPTAGSSIFAGDNCTINYYLQAGQKVRMSVFHNLGTNKTLHVGSVGSQGFQNFSVKEN